MSDCKDAEGKADWDAFADEAAQNEHTIMVADLERLSEWQRKVADALGVSDGPGLETHGRWYCADADQAAAVAKSLRSAELSLAECLAMCELCGEMLAREVCEHCHGSGAHNQMSAAHLAYVECGWCAGVGKVHLGCVERSYTELVAERDAAFARAQQAERLIDELLRVGPVDNATDRYPHHYHEHLRIPYREGQRDGWSSALKRVIPKGATTTTGDEA